MRTSIRPWLIGLGVVPLALALTGCFGGPSIPGSPPGGGVGGDEPVDEELVEDILEGSGDGIDFEMGELPADFPVDAIPLVEGDVATAISIPGSGGTTSWQVTILAADEATANGADELLIAAGFSNESVIGYEKDGYLVVIAGTAVAEGGWHVSYLVTQQ